MDEAATEAVCRYYLDDEEQNFKDWAEENGFDTGSEEAEAHVYRFFSRKPLPLRSLDRREGRMSNEG